MSSSSDSQQVSANAQMKTNADSENSALSTQIELSQVYVLIDSILPFEACLYYQVLPLYIEGSRLVIGTVNPEDLTASEYVKKQLSYINYSITFKEIPSDWHRDLLSKYLSHNAKKRQQPKPAVSEPSPPTAAKKARSQAKSMPDPDSQQTFIVDQPEEIPADEVLEVSPSVPERPLTAIPRAPEPSPAEPTAPAVPVEDELLDLRSSSSAAPLHLQIDEQYRHISDTQLAALQPKALMQALLVKVLDEGIGRLYFERQSQSGRILWSRDGILQAVVESIDTQLFQGVINEFKLLTHLSLIAVKKAKQVEIERSYEGQRILLRFRVMPNAYGEEATLQVLRGTALRFYQQQQIDKLGRDALDAAQILQRRLQEIRDRARQSLNFKSTRSETLPALIELLKQMEAQVQEIVEAYDLQSEGQPGSELEADQPHDQ